ncbi:uncharacterized protein METZ01_LOCUS223828, partial [marine metagenome]
MVVTLKVRTLINRIITPGSPNSFSKARAVMVTPFTSWEFQTPDTRIIKAVMEHTRMVSIKGPIIATSPSRTGSFVFAA